MAPGKYELVVYHTDNNLIWKNNPLTLGITIRPPFYMTTWAYLIYVCLLSSILYVIVISYKGRLKQRNAALLAEAIHKEKQRSNDMKLKFFADVSHEIKTPLTLIYTPLSELCSSEFVGHDKVGNRLDIVMKNAERLKSLVENLIDMENKSVDYDNLAIVKVDVVAFCKEIVSLFQDFASAKNIEYSFFFQRDSVVGYFDAVKIEKVLFNLISNAFKFTSSGGYVKVSLYDDEHHFEIHVEDNGIGISKNEQKKIFERYYRGLNTGQQGSGIGLALSELIIHNHHGSLTVESEKGKGSLFVVSMLKGYSHYKEESIMDSASTLTAPFHLSQSKPTDSESIMLSSL